MNDHTRRREDIARVLAMFPSSAEHGTNEPIGELAAAIEEVAHGLLDVARALRRMVREP